MSSQPKKEEDFPDDFELTPPPSPSGVKQRSLNRNNTDSVNERMRDYVHRITDSKNRNLLFLKGSVQTC